MFLSRSKSNVVWQKKYLKEVFEVARKYKQNYTKTILGNRSLLNNKDEYFPNTLYKFYAPTSDNILDIKNKRLWMSKPSSFNDPFDCYIGYDEEAYEKYSLLKIIKKQELISREDNFEKFTDDEISRIEQSKTDYCGLFSRYEDYLSVKYNIINQKSDSLQRDIRQLLFQLKKEANEKIKCIQNHNIRVSCFSNLDRDEEVFKKIQMWSHYADNHNGFCVEYDVSSLKGEQPMTLESFEYYKDQNTYIKERTNTLVKGGIFPVIYSSQRVNLPVTKLYKIQVEDLNNNIDEINYKAFIIKSSNWSYEKEWRIILEDKICQYYDNKIPFPYIKKIYLGCRMNPNLMETMLELGDELGVEVSIVATSSKKFVLEERNSKYYRSDKEWNKSYQNPFI